MSEEEKNERKADLFNLIGQLTAFLTIVVYICVILDANLHFIPEGELLVAFKTLKTYAPLVLVLVVGLQFAQERDFLIKLALYISIVVIILFQFFPGTWQNFIGILSV